MVLPVHGMWTVIGDILGSHKKPTGNCDKNKKLNNDTIIANLL